MPEFKPGQTVDTKEPTIEVTASAQKPFQVGRMVFELVVVDNSGNESLPARVEVNVIDDEKPTAILQAPSRVSAAQPFTLDGRRSTDAPGGHVVRYRWTRVE